MSKNKKQYNKGEQGTTSLLRFSVISLSVVSFFTTANGMEKYIFSNDRTIAYLTSAAIQGILLALSMGLPEFLGNIWRRPEKNGKGDSKNPKDMKDSKDSEGKKESIDKKVIILPVLIKFILSIGVIALTIVTIFCSSLFSYIYIAEVIHKDSWDSDSELLVQQSYRAELYNARDYVHAYRTYLESNIAEVIMQLEEQTRQISDSEEKYDINWEEERDVYVKESETTSGSYMATVITAMENALAEGGSQDDRDIAMAAIVDAKTRIEQRIESIRQDQTTLADTAASYDRQITSLRNQINSATEGTDITRLSNNLNALIESWSNVTSRQTVLQEEAMALDSAHSRLDYYEGLLGLFDSGSGISIRKNLLLLQTEFFKSDPDQERLLEITNDIFEAFRNAVRNSAETGEMEGSFSYSELMLQMNQLIQRLTDYHTVREIETNLAQVIEELYNEGVEDKENSESEVWKDTWRMRIGELKAQVSAMPVYSAAEMEETKEISALSETQINLLISFDRDRAGRELDDLIRRYISSHNAIYQGIIYLQSPYWNLAAFALCLALAFDLSGFIFGFVAQGNSRQDGKEDQKSKQTFFKEERWSILKTLGAYIILTGDHKHKDETYYYKTFKDGELYWWEVEDALPDQPYQRGIYIQEIGDAGKIIGRKLFPNEQDLLFNYQQRGRVVGPQDGIFPEGQIIYEDGSLIFVQDEERRYIAAIDEYVPVHYYNSKQGESRTLPSKQIAKKGIDAQEIVVALNDKGTRVAAIYIFKY